YSVAFLISLLHENFSIFGQQSADLDNDIEANADDLPGTVTSRNFNSQAKGIVRRTTNMKSLSGADHMAYFEGTGGHGRPSGSTPRKKAPAKEHHPLFKRQWMKK
ncbi:12410_t:CDS:1, partial [Gigaspora rosea]